MIKRLENHIHSRRGTTALLALANLAMAASVAKCEESTPQPTRMPKLREVVEIPEDYYGRKFTFAVRITTRQGWIKRGAAGDFFVMVQDLEGSSLPNNGLGPDSTVNIIRFLLPKEEGRKLFERLNAQKLYDASITFTIDREPPVLGYGWVYLARISSVELR